jgi:hypothetical protein
MKQIKRRTLSGMRMAFLSLQQGGKRKDFHRCTSTRLLPWAACDFMACESVCACARLLQPRQIDGEAWRHSISRGKGPMTEVAPSPWIADGAATEHVCIRWRVTRRVVSEKVPRRKTHKQERPQHISTTSRHGWPAMVRHMRPQRPPQPQCRPPGVGIYGRTQPS